MALEENGIPSVLITNLPTVAQSMGVPRYLTGVAIPHVVGNPDLPPDRERRLRRQLVEQALALVTK